MKKEVKAANDSSLLLPLTILSALVCFCHSLLRDMKDALVITSSDLGATAIPFIQVWMLLPATVIAAALFTHLLQRYGQQRTFYIVVGAFISFFLLFACILYPLRDLLHAHSLLHSPPSWLPQRLEGVTAMFSVWTFSIFYVSCELWSALVTAVLFWSLYTEIFSMDKASKNYGIVSLGGSIGTVSAGQISRWIQSAPADWAVYLILGTIICGALALLSAYHWLCSSHLQGEKYRAFREAGNPKNNKKRTLSFSQAIAELGKCRYLLSLAVMVVGYNLTLNLSELLFKNQLKLLCPDFGAYNAYLSYISTSVGVLSCLLALAVPLFMTNGRWIFTALICPICLLLSGACFFTLLIFRDHLPIDPQFAIALTVFSGAVMNALGRATKYSLFDATKDVAFIPLDYDVRVKSKAVIDGVGSRLGRSGASLLYQGLIVIFSVLSATAPYIAILIIAILIAWFLGIRHIGQHLQLSHQESVVKNTEIIERSSLENKESKLAINQ